MNMNMNMNNNENNAGAGAGAGARAAAGPRRSTRERKKPTTYSPITLKLHRTYQKGKLANTTRRKPAAPKRTLTGKELAKYEDEMTKGKRFMLLAREENAKGFSEVAKDLRTQARRIFGDAHAMLRDRKLPSNNRNANLNALLNSMAGLHM